MKEKQNSIIRETKWGGGETETERKEGQRKKEKPIKVTVSQETQTINE